MSESSWWTRVAWVAGLHVLVVVATGCAHLPGLPGRPADRSAARELPTDGPPEFHVLVAQDLAAEGRHEEALAAYERALAGDPDSGFLHRRVAELAARTNQLDLAVEHAEGALALEPDDDGIRLFLGTLYRFRRDAVNAERVLRAESGEPNSGEAAALLYAVLGEAGRLEEAREVARWLVDRVPDLPRSYLALADVEEKLGHPAEAEAVLRRGLIRHPGDLALYGMIARGRHQRDDREGEIAIYREMLGEHPGHLATLLAKADAELSLGNNDAARVTLEAALYEQPRDLRTLLRLGFLDFEEEDFGSAAERFRRALTMQPRQQEVIYFLGVALRRQSDETGAREALVRIGRDHPRFADARTQLAGMAEAEGDFDGAVAYLEEARSAAKSRALDLYMGSLQAKSGDVVGALALLETMLDGSAADADVLYNIGIIQGEASHIDEALRTMETVLGLDPTHAGALNYVGYTWAERGENLEEAEALISRALEQRPDDGFITDSLGWIYYMRARPLVEAGRRDEAQPLIEQARAALEKAVRLTGGDPVISEHLGDVFLLEGNRGGALERYEEAIRLGPRDNEQPGLFEKLERLREELEQN
ncbi:MAG: tetratricopeptide repeat protein [bacterium]|nr:tetratricopeptide repeat protein [bacterium]